MKKSLTLAVLIGITVLGSVNSSAASEAKLIEDIYIVRQGDTLRGISRDFLLKNTYGVRNILEFESGINELNYELFKDRPPMMIYPGDELRINYWVKKDDAQ